MKVLPDTVTSLKVGSSQDAQPELLQSVRERVDDQNLNTHLSSIM